MQERKSPQEVRPGHFIQLKVVLDLQLEFLSLNDQFCNSVVVFKCPHASNRDVGLVHNQIYPGLQLVRSDPLDVLETSAEIKRSEASMNDLQSPHDGIGKLLVAGVFVGAVCSQSELANCRAQVLTLKALFHLQFIII